MARTTHVKSARKDQGTCQKCGKKIRKGDPYKWVAPRAHRGARGYKQKRCADCPGWRASELTSSQHLSTIYGAQEAFDDFLSEWDRATGDDLAQALRDCAESVREASESYNESAENIESGFGHETSMSEELREKATEVESWADEIESAADDIEDFDEDSARSDAESEITDEIATELDYEGDDITEHDEYDAEDFERRVEEKISEAREEWADEQASKADITQECPV